MKTMLRLSIAFLLAGVWMRQALLSYCIHKASWCVFQGVRLPGADGLEVFKICLPAL